ncbi:MAG: NAD(P)-binding domain-containing protein [Candidatus Microsaccharimonas sp.]
MKENIGIIGLGSLGSRLATQIASAGCNVIAFDSDRTKSVEREGITVVGSQAEVLQSCSIVHWAIPSKLLNIPSSDLQDVIIVLHDSVMNNSKEALARRSDSEKFAVVHLLMNSAKRVFVASDASHSQDMMQHLEAVGLSPKLATIKDHDLLMAHTQGILALLIKLGLKDKLDQASMNGDLTPSADELHRTMVSPELDWTTNTLNSILVNPELKQVVKAVVATVNKREDNRK